MPNFCTNCGGVLEPDILRCPACNAHIREDIKQSHLPYIDDYHPLQKEYRKPHIAIKLGYLSFFALLIISGFLPYLHYYFRSESTYYQGGLAQESVRYVYHEIIGFGIIFFWGAAILFLVSVILLFTHRRVMGSMVTGFIGCFFMLQVILFVDLFRQHEYVGESWLGIGYFLGMFAFAGLGVITFILISYLGQVKD